MMDGELPLVPTTPRLRALRRRKVLMQVLPLI
jgi:hypothetical protein